MEPGQAIAGATLLALLGRIADALEGINESLGELTRGYEEKVTDDGERVETVEGPPRIILALEEIAENTRDLEDEEDD